MHSPQLAAIHGVAHGPKERATYLQDWAQAAQAGLCWTSVPWSSTGGRELDWVSSWASPGVYDGHVSEVHRGLIAWELSTRGEPRAIVAHSWGSVLVHAARTHDRLLATIPTVYLGSPYTHPWLGRRLRWAGRADPWDRTRGPAPLMIGSHADPVSSIWRWSIGVEGARELWIDMARPLVHAPGAYLQHRVVRSTIAQAVRGGRDP